MNKPESVHNHSLVLLVLKTVKEKSYKMFLITYCIIYKLIFVVKCECMSYKKDISLSSNIIKVPFSFSSTVTLCFVGASFFDL